MEMASVPPPPGWYVDPQGGGQRWWNGTQWTEHVSSDPSQPQVARASTGDWIGGVFLSVLFPLVGLIAGLVYAFQGGSKARCGWLCIALSLTAIVIWAGLISSMNQPH